LLKILYKTITVVLTTAIVYISCCSASDSGVMTGQEPAYIPPPSVQESPKTLVIKKSMEEKPAPAEKAEKPPVEKPERPAQPDQMLDDVIGKDEAVQAVAPEVDEADKTKEEQPPEQQPSPQPVTEPQIEQPQKSENLLGKVVSALLKSIALILAASGLYYLYKKIMALKGAPKSVVDGGKPDEPKSVGEAISSYIKHKLRK